MVCFHTTEKGGVKLKKCGIYALKNIVNNKLYIGQSTDIDSRKYHHYYDLRHHKHHSCKLQQDYDLYGKDNFEFLIKVTVNSKNHYCKHIFMFDLNNNFIKPQLIKNVKSYLST